MNSHALRQPQTGLVKVAAISFFLHIALLFIALFLVKPEPKRLFFIPVSTVSLVHGASGFAEQGAAPGKTGEKPVLQKKERQADGGVKKKAIKETSSGKAKAHDNGVLALKSALKDIERKVEARELVAARIESMRKKTLTASSFGHGRGHAGKESSSGRAGQTAKDRGNAIAGVAGSGGQAGAGGVSAESLDVKYRAYLIQITERVQEQWEFPAELERSGISVIVSLKIGKDGKLINSWVEKSSGYTLFDESLMKAVTRAAPYPALPAGFEGDFLEVGLRFCPGCGG